MHIPPEVLASAQSCPLQSLPAPAAICQFAGPYLETSAQGSLSFWVPKMLFGGPRDAITFYILEGKQARGMKTALKLKSNQII